MPDKARKTIATHVIQEFLNSWMKGNESKLSFDKLGANPHLVVCLNLNQHKPAENGGGGSYYFYGALESGAIDDSTGNPEQYDVRNKPFSCFLDCIKSTSRVAQVKLTSEALKSAWHNRENYHKQIEEPLSEMLNVKDLPETFYLTLAPSGPAALGIYHKNKIEADGIQGLAHEVLPLLTGLLTSLNLFAVLQAVLAGRLGDEESASKQMLLPVDGSDNDSSPQWNILNHFKNYVREQLLDNALEEAVRAVTAQTKFRQFQEAFEIVRERYDQMVPWIVPGSDISLPPNLQQVINKYSSGDHHDAPLASKVLEMIKHQIKRGDTA